MKKLIIIIAVIAVASILAFSLKIVPSVGQYVAFQGRRYADGYKPFREISPDGKYYLETMKIEYASGVKSAKFVIMQSDTGKIIYTCPYSFRLFDLKYMNWAYDGTNNVLVKSGDVGNYLYMQEGGSWNETVYRGS